ncbi:hypothetical protein HN51_059471 [Arachis hypogaea]|uniref:NAC domain-containing protein n=1 Tax=Arachis hypogaea TaxID=3818 RepID=A0A444X5Q6_ARAHY|nr:NAC domain-containing protein 104 isoform X1 [Arachis ipaensis]XP_025685978.1 NAC domain-containing protein 104 isoform X1 [Arachis hypogaea]QHN82879.1 NAC transcription factor 25-like [Arachis hypogaea]RYQ85015.1 hypothetical protein Ahy_B10g104498 isoform E [Arachis hypogaea]
MMMMTTTSTTADYESVKQLPPGFLFSPTDEELVLHFLYAKASLLPCHPNIIPDLDLSLAHPSQLNDKALSSGNQYYFFSKVKEKRITENGYWKEIGESEAILSSTVEKKVGTKKNLVFHIGEAPHGIETSWVMQEYHICRSSNIISTSRARRKHDHQIWSKWVLCKVYEKKGSVRGVNYCSDDDDSGTELSWLDEIYLSLDDDLEEISVSILD